MGTIIIACVAKIKSQFDFDPIKEADESTHSNSGILGLFRVKFNRFFSKSQQENVSSLYKILSPTISKNTSSEVRRAIENKLGISRFALICSITSPNDPNQNQVN